MADDADFAALKAQGAAPEQVYAQARQEGLAQMDAVRLLRALFGLSLDGAREVAWEADGYPAHVLPPLRSRAALDEYLRTHLGYCSCACDALPALRELLDLAQARTDATGDPAEFSRLSRQVEIALNPPFGAAFAAWTVFTLERQGLVWHGFRLADLWIHPKGRALLQAIHDYPEPPPEPDDQESGDEP